MPIAHGLLCYKFGPQDAAISCEIETVPRRKNFGQICLWRLFNKGLKLSNLIFLASMLFVHPAAQQKPVGL